MPVSFIFLFSLLKITFVLFLQLIPICNLLFRMSDIECRIVTFSHFDSPNGFSSKSFDRVINFSCMFCIQHLKFIIHHNSLWWFCRGCSPLPIPNREVKPLMADGTAQQCGRVGSCHIHLKKPFRKLRGFFVL